MPPKICSRHRRSSENRVEVINLKGKFSLIKKLSFVRIAPFRYQEEKNNSTSQKNLINAEHRRLKSS